MIDCALGFWVENTRERCKAGERKVELYIHERMRGKGCFRDKEIYTYVEELMNVLNRLD